MNAASRAVAAAAAWVLVAAALAAAVTWVALDIARTATP